MVFLLNANHGAYSNPRTQVLDMDFSTVPSVAQAKHSVIIPVNTTIGCCLHLFNHSNHPDSGIRDILAGGIRNPEFKESGIPLTIGRNPSSTDKESVIQYLDYNQ